MTVSVSDVEIILTKTEFSLLEYFVKNAKWVIKRDSLMKDIIGYDNYIYDRTIDTHVKNIRKKLEWSIEIETVRGVWYRVNSID
jgi:DNA-binding response OmpR family regulator